MSRRTRRKAQMHCKTKHMSCNEGSDNLQAKKLLHCLSSKPLRRWCTYEWFYSAVDYPRFSNNEFVLWLVHEKLSHLSRLTRSEWSIVRSSIGTRRFSNHFLAVEREKLEDYLEKARKIYAQLSDGSRNSPPADLARPFSIGQQVIVRHPSSRELCDDKVVMMGPDCYKVHFDDPDLGVGIVKCSMLEMDHIPDLTPSENWDHAVNGATILKGLKSPCLTSDRQPKAECIVNSERPPYRSTSDGPTNSIGCPDNNAGHNDELESYIAAFVERSLSQAWLIIDEAMQRLVDSQHPYANVAGILEHASSLLRPRCSENLAV